MPQPYDLTDFDDWVRAGIELGHFVKWKARCKAEGLIFAAEEPDEAELEHTVPDRLKNPGNALDECMEEDDE